MILNQFKETFVKLVVIYQEVITFEKDDTNLVWR